ncbi:cytochrome P450 [Aspergillus karnatakaensis]|uniref:cytochrome P450 n=1 Tax=Aspergillus karnatakaensis TaxID=1810916 RepID=UPI003CCD7EB4
MKKLDSFIRESLRVTPHVASLLIFRIVMAGSFEFEKDFVLPNGALCAFPHSHMLWDSDDYPDPHKFDGLRFYNSKGDRASAVKRNHDLLRGWSTFGVGRQACPGRFFALTFFNIVLGEIILRYDVRYVGEERPRPSMLDLGLVFAADPTVELEFRARGKS